MSDSEFSRVIRMIRADCDMTQAKLADALGVSTTYVSLLESGKRQPSWKMALAIAEVCGYQVVFRKRGAHFPFEYIGVETGQQDQSLLESLKRAGDLFTDNGDPYDSEPGIRDHGRYK